MTGNFFEKMKLVSTLAIIGLLVNGISASDPLCMNACINTRKELRSGPACREARRSLPRPKIGEQCGRAYNKGAELACKNVCQDGTDVALKTFSEELFNYCKDAKAASPKPLLGDACVSGFSASYKDTVSLMENVFAEAETSGGFADLKAKQEAKKLAEEEALAKLEAEKAEAEKLEAEKQAQIAEAKRVELEAQLAAEKEAQAKIEEEKEAQRKLAEEEEAQRKLAAEAEEAQAKLTAEAEAQAKLEAEIALQKEKTAKLQADLALQKEQEQAAAAEEVVDMNTELQL